MGGVLTPPTARAQETRESEIPDLEEQQLRDHIRVSLTGAGRFVGPSDFGSFEVSSAQPEARLRFSTPVAKNAALRFLGTFRSIRWLGDSPDFDPRVGGTVDDLNEGQMRLQGAYLFDKDSTLFRDDERWAVLSQFGVRTTWEHGSDAEEGLRYGGSLIVGYIIRDRLEIAAGISLASRVLRGGVSVGPLVEFDWKISDDWRLRSYGLGLQLERKLLPTLTAFTRGRLESRSYRLDERGGTIGRGVIRYRQAPVGVGLRWRPRRWLRLQAMVGAMTYQELRIRDEDRNTIAKESGTATGYMSLRGDLRW